MAPCADTSAVVGDRHFNRTAVWYQSCGDGDRALVFAVAVGDGVVGVDDHVQPNLVQGAAASSDQWEIGGQVGDDLGGRFPLVPDTATVVVIASFTSTDSISSDPG